MSTFNLMGLPRELLLRVLESALVSEHPCLINRIEHERYRGPLMTHVAERLALTRTCRTLHKEGTAIFYGKNTFIADGMITIHLFSFNTSARASVESFILLDECYKRAESFLEGDPTDLSLNSQEALSTCYTTATLYLALRRFHQLRNIIFYLEWGTLHPKIYNLIRRIVLELPTLKSIEIQRPYYHYCLRAIRLVRCPMIMNEYQKERWRKDAEENKAMNEYLLEKISERLRRERNEPAGVTTYLKERKQMMLLEWPEEVSPLEHQLWRWM
ncbi:hypothetical protein MMC12_002910 [Toensbergia leucococca]|nr:hypothetical protein [Toensbergia leucococca]